MIQLDYEPTDRAQRPSIVRRIINLIVKVRPLMLDGGSRGTPSPRELRALANLREMLRELEEDPS